MVRLPDRGGARQKKTCIPINARIWVPSWDWKREAAPTRPGRMPIRALLP